MQELNIDKTNTENKKTKCRIKKIEINDLL